jgi:murein DD-endopeptidase MepM/ murein hydrolase activator NlpD
MNIRLKKFVYILLLMLSLSACSNGRWLNLSSLWGGSDSVRVAKGDTLYSISRSYGVPLKDLINVNHLKAPYTLYVGQTLRLPSKQYHTVKRGESLYSIARDYNVDITTLSKVNNLTTPYSLSVGQKLLLPGSVSAKASSVSAQRQQTSSTVQSTKNNIYQSAPVEDSYVPSTTRKTKFDWPVKGRIISGFGNLGSGRKNDGINIKADLGTTVKAADAGTVAYAGNELKGFGNLILIKHNDGWITAYAHNDKLFVTKGQKVKRGEKIASVGSTGSVTTPQLHFEVRSGKKAVNPRPYLP